MRQKVAYIATFIAGLLFTSPSLMYISIACAAILLLQSRNKKVAILGLVLVAVQIVIVSVFIELMINAARGVP